MKKYLLNLNNLDIEKRPFDVFFASHQSIVYRHSMSINQESCNGTLLNKVSLPIDYRNYHVLDFDDATLFLFSGKDLLLLDKHGFEPIQYQLDNQKLGRCVTELHPSTETNQVIFGTKFLNRIQFINFDFIQQQRVCQTLSWQLNDVSDSIVRENTLYGLLDNSFIACCDMSTGEVLWTRFEAGYVRPKILPYNDTLLYACQNVLKIANRQRSEPIKIPLVRVYSLLQVLGNRLYFTNNEGRNICSYNLKKKVLEWEIVGDHEILESLLVKGLYEDKQYDILLVRTASHLGIINLTKGKAVHFRKVPNLRRIIQTDDHILLLKRSAETEMIASYDQ